MKSVKPLLLIAAVLALAPAEAGQATPPSYDELPIIFVKPAERAFFADELFGTGAERRGIDYASDSTGSPVLGDPEVVNYWQERFYNHFGVCDATPMNPISGYGGENPNIPGTGTAEWLVFGGESGIVMNGSYPDISGMEQQYLLPGVHIGVNPPFVLGPAQSATKRFYRTVGGRQGAVIVLNHRNANSGGSMWNCGQVKGYSYVPAGINIGRNDFAIGGADGGKSAVDMRGSNGASALRLRIIAGTNPNGGEALHWFVGAWDDSNICSGGTSDITLLAEGTMFGGQQNLHAAAGAFYSGLTDHLPALGPTQRMYVGIATSEAQGDPSQGVHIVQMNFVSDNAGGRMIHPMSFGGIAAWHIPQYFSQCGALLQARGNRGMIIRYGHNDPALDDSSPQAFESNIRQIIAIARAAMGDDYWFILESTSPKAIEGPDGPLYAGALYAIAQDTSNVMFLNSRLAARQRHQFGTVAEGGSGDSYRKDNTHLTNLGAEVLARAGFDTLRNYLLGTGPTLRVRQCDGLLATTGQVRATIAIAGGDPSAAMTPEPQVLAVGRQPVNGNTTMRMLLGEDLNDIPQGSTILSHSWRLRVAGSTGTGAAACSLWLLNPAASTFPEMVNGDYSGSGPVFSLMELSSRTPWPGGPGAFAARDTAFAPLAFNLMPVNQYLTLDGPNLLAMTQAVVNRNDRNYRLLGKKNAETDYRRNAFAGPTHPTPAFRPLSRIEFTPPPAPPCPCDVTGDSVIDFDDVLTVIFSWGACAGFCPADVNHDSVVNFDDVLVVIQGWGDCP